MVMHKYLLTFIIKLIVFSYSYAQSINPQILWATYLGSPGDDFTGYVVTDSLDNIYVSSTVENGAPTTTGVHQTTYGGGVSDVMLSKFDKNGALLWSTYFGGTGEDANYFTIGLMSDGGIAITGTTTSSNRIATQGAHDVSYGGGTSDVFIAVFETDGKLRWSTYFGSAGIDGEPALSIDSEDNIYLIGYTTSTTGIATSGSFQPTKSGNEDGFIAKFDKNGKLVWATYHGGQGYDAFYSVNTDQNGNVYMGGETYSSQLVTAGSFKANYGGNGDGFLAKFSKEGERLWATYFGSGGYDGIYYMAVDGDSNIVCIGPSASPGGIASSGAFQDKNAGKNDVFIAKFNPNGQRLWSTFFGGEEWDTTFDCDFDKDNNIYISMMSQSQDLPITEDVPGISYNGGLWDAAFVKFSKDGDLKWATYFGGDGNDRSIGITLDSEQNIIASVNSDSKGLATPGAYNETARSNETLLVKMQDATIVSTSELENLQALNVFPNPTSSIIQIPNFNNEKRNIAVYNSCGDMVRRYMFTEVTEFDLSRLPNGQYYIVSDIDGKISLGKVIKVD
jgi:hypothetical protein